MALPAICTGSSEVVTCYLLSSYTSSLLVPRSLVADCSSRYGADLKTMERRIRSIDGVSSQIPHFRRTKPEKQSPTYKARFPSSHASNTSFGRLKISRARRIPGSAPEPSSAQRAGHTNCEIGRSAVAIHSNCSGAMRTQRFKYPFLQDKLKSA